MWLLEVMDVEKFLAFCYAINGNSLQAELTLRLLQAPRPWGEADPDRNSRVSLPS